MVRPERLPAAKVGEAQAERPALGLAADGLIGVDRQFTACLDSKGVKPTFIEIPDPGHVWPLWRQNLRPQATALSECC